MNKILTHGSTFSGIGAAEIAAEMLGWRNAFHCEINPFGKTILDYYFPNAESYDDITTTDFTKWRGKIDILTGGFPCQPFSYAGKRKGSEDDRYLWPYMLRCINQIRPTWFVGENVAGITTMVFPGKDVEVASGASLFEETHYMARNERFVISEICQQLEDSGYSVQPFVIPACAVGAPHRRDRVFFIAHRNAENPDSMGFQGNEIMGNVQRPGNAGTTGNVGETERPVTDTNGIRQCTFRGNGFRGQTMDRGCANKSLNGVRRFGNARAASDTCCNQHRTSSESREPKANRGYRLCQPCKWCNQTKRIDGLSDVQGNSANTKSKQERCTIDRGSCSEAQKQHRGSGKQNDLLEYASNANGKRRGQIHAKIQTGVNNGPESVSNGRERNVTNTNDDGLQETRATEPSAMFDGKNLRYLQPENRWRAFPTVSPVYRGNDGLPFDVDDLTISFAKWKNESLKAYGNAIVVQVMYEIFRAIDEIEKLNNNKI